MSCHCGGRCGTCAKMGGGPFSAPFGVGVGDNKMPPVNFPSPLQAALAVGDRGPAGVPHQPRATTAVQKRSQMGQGTAIGSVTHRPWAVNMANWGSVARIRWAHLIANRGENRVRVIDYLFTRGDLRPQWQGDTRVRRQQYPALDEPTYNFAAVTDAQVMALAKARAAARVKAGR